MQHNYKKELLNCHSRLVWQPIIHCNIVSILVSVEGVCLALLAMQDSLVVMNDWSLDCWLILWKTLLAHFIMEFGLPGLCHF